MRAAILTGFNEPMEIEEVSVPEIGPHDVLVRVTASGVCHSDLSVQNGSVPMPPPPCVLGHEGTGVIEKVGSSVSRVKEGETVIAGFVPTCGKCFWCRNQQTHLCETWIPSNMSPRFVRSDGNLMPALCGLGTFAEEMQVSENAVVPIQTDLPSEQLALIGCGFTTGTLAVLNTAGVVPGSTVAVIGCGGVGQSVIQGARVAGAAEIYAIDPVELKRKTAEQFGATHGIDPSKENAVAKVQEWTEGRGADYVFEVIGRAETMQQAYEMTRDGGTCVMVGMAPITAAVTLPAIQLALSEKRVLGCRFGSAQIRRDFPRLVKLVENGRLDLDSMISRKIKLDEVNDAFRAMEAGEVIRSVIVQT